MANKSPVQINLPPMPDPKDFRNSDNPSVNYGQWQLALTAWEKVSLASTQAVADALAPDVRPGAVRVPVVVTTSGNAPDSGAEPLLKTGPDRTKN